MEKDKNFEKNSWKYNFLTMVACYSSIACIMIFIGLFIFLINYALATISLTPEQVKATTYGIIILFALFFLINIFTLILSLVIKVKSIKEVKNYIEKVEVTNNEKVIN